MPGKDLGNSLCVVTAVSPLGDGVIDVPERHVNNVTHLVLCVVGDSDGDGVAVDLRDGENSSWQIARPSLQHPALTWHEGSRCEPRRPEPGETMPCTPRRAAAVTIAAVLGPN